MREESAVQYEASTLEYCNTNGSKRIYCFKDFERPDVTFLTAYDEDCFMLQLLLWRYPENSVFPHKGYALILSDGTIEYKGDIYHFNRVVLYKNKKN